LGKTTIARADIDVAARLVPSDSAVALEQGNIEATDGNYEAAEKHWRNVLAIRPEGRTADAARKLLSQLESNGTEVQTDSSKLVAE